MYCFVVFFFFYWYNNLELIVDIKFVYFGVFDKLDLWEVDVSIVVFNIWFLFVIIFFILILLDMI